MKKWVVVISVALGLMLITTVVGSFVACYFVSSYDTCRMLPTCSATLTDGTDGPGWHCDPILAE